MSDLEEMIKGPKTAAQREFERVAVYHGARLRERMSHAIADHRAFRARERALAEWEAFRRL